jgi:hypothetical protein
MAVFGGSHSLPEPCTGRRYTENVYVTAPTSRRPHARIRALGLALTLGALLLAGCSPQANTGLTPQTGAPTSGGVATPSGASPAPAGPVAGVAIALGKPAIVISPCPGDVVTEVGAFSKDANDVTKSVWLAKSTNGRRLVVMGIGVAPRGYENVVPYATPLPSASLTGKVIVKTARGKSFTVSTADSFADATASEILVNGNYLSFNEFMQQYSLCSTK